MPRFYFHIHDGEFIPDEDGTELPDVSAARIEAARYAGQLLANKPEQAWETEGWSVEVTDDHRLVLFKLIVLATAGPALVESPQP